MERVSQVAVVGGTGFPTSVNVAGPLVYNPYGHPASLTFGNGVIETYGVNSDYHITSFKLAPTVGSALINRTFSWTGETLDSIADAAVPGNSETLTYSKRHALNAATGPYGALSWTYDVDHNRLTQRRPSRIPRIPISFPASCNRVRPRGCLATTPLETGRAM